MTDYEATRRDFRLDPPADFNFTRDVIDDWAAKKPTKTALVWVDEGGGERRELSYADLSKGANRVANALEGIDTAPADRAFVMLPRLPDWWLLLLGMFKAGVVPTPATVMCTPRDIEYRINRAEASIVVTDPDGVAKVEEVKDRCPTLKHTIVLGDGASGWTNYEDWIGSASDSPAPARATSKEDPLVLYFTSGTVGYPKMVLHTHASYGFAHQITGRFWMDLTADDLHWTISDTGWAKAAWGCLFPQWFLGASVFVWDQRGKMDPEQCLRVLERSGATTFCAPPTLYRSFVQLDLGTFDLKSLRHTMSAGEPLNPEVSRIWKAAVGLDIYEGYGQTETVNLAATYPCIEVRPGSMGKPTPGFDTDVVDDDGKRLGAGDEGNIAVRVKPERPVGMMEGYWRDEKATESSFRHGWYFTGDRAQKDVDGYIWFVGRDDDVIISASYRIGPFEVESALIEHAAVAEAAVVAKPDPDRTNIVKAYIVLAAGYEGGEALASELQDHVKKVTAPYKYPREIDFVTELPKTISGKIRRVELRERETSEERQS